MNKDLELATSDMASCHDLLDKARAFLKAEVDIDSLDVESFKPFARLIVTKKNVSGWKTSGKLDAEASTNVLEQLEQVNQDFRQWVDNNLCADLSDTLSDITQWCDTQLVDVEDFSPNSKSAEAFPGCVPAYSTLKEAFLLRCFLFLGS